MIDFYTKSGSHYRIDMAARTVECVAPPEVAFPARLVLRGMASDSGPDVPVVGRPYIAFWSEPDELGRAFMRTSLVVRSEVTGPPPTPEVIAAMGRVGRALFGPDYTAPGESS